METMNKLPVRTYVRQRISTVVINIAEQSSGTVSLNLAAPSDVTIILVTDPGAEPPTFFVAAAGRNPDMSDFDVIISPVSTDFVKPVNNVTLHLPATQSDLCWASFDSGGSPAAFGTMGLSKLVVAIDQ